MKEIERGGGGCSLQGEETEGDTKRERETFASITAPTGLCFV